MRVGTAFTIDPPVRFLDPVQVRVPASDLPEGRDEQDVVLAVSSNGVGEGGSMLDPDSTDEPGTLRVHPLWTATADAGFAVFSAPAISPDTVYQPMVVGPLPDGASGPAFSIPVLGTQIGESCSDALTAAGVAPPVGIDDHVQVSAAIGGETIINYFALPAAQQADFLASVDRYIARTCYSIWATKLYYRDTMLIDVFPTTFAGAPVAVPVTILWDHFEADGSCNTSPGNASGNGITMYFNYVCGAPYKGWMDPGEPGAFTSGYNRAFAAGESPAMVDDHLEATLAHELFHYTEDWSNGAPGDSVWGIDELDTVTFGAFVEGGANTGSEESYDDVPGNASLPTRITSQSFFSESYRAHTFWRWLDWAQDNPTRTGSPVARILRRVRDRTVANGFCLTCSERILPGDLDAAIEEMFPSRSDYDLSKAFVDYAFALLWEHEFERDIPSDSIFDRYVDVLGKLTDEEAAALLWGAWAGSGNPLRYTTTDPSKRTIAPASNAALPITDSPFAVNAYGGRVMELDLSNLDSGSGAASVRLSLWATDPNGAPLEHVGLRLVRPDSGSFIGLWSLDTISDDPNGWSTTVIPPADFAADLVLVLANHDSADVEIGVKIEPVVEMGLALAAFDGTVLGLDLNGPATMPFCDDPLATVDLGETYRSAVVRLEAPVDGAAVAYPYNDFIKVFDRSSCLEVASVNFAAVGPGPVAMEVTPDGQQLVVAQQDPADACAAGEISVVDLSSLTVIANVALPVGAGDLVLLDGASGLEAVVTQTGHETDCFSSFLRSVVIADLVAAGLNAPANLVTDIPVGGQSVHLPTQMARTADRQWAAWVTTNSSGRVGLIDAATHTPVVFDPLDPVGAPWELPQDVDIAQHPTTGRLRLYFVYSWETIFSDDPWVDCEEQVLDCSAGRWLDYDPSTGDLVRSGERTLPWASVNRIAITPDLGTAYVTYSNRSILTPVDLGTGNLDAFLPYTSAPMLVGEPWPVSLWMP